MNNEKRRISDLLREKNEKEHAIQVLRNQLSTVQHQQQPAIQMNAQQQHHYQELQKELQRSNEDNYQLSKRLEQQKLSSSNHPNSSDSVQSQLQVMTNELKRLAMENSSWEKKVKANDEILKKSQEKHDQLYR